MDPPVYIAPPVQPRELVIPLSLSLSSPSSLTLSLRRAVLRATDNAIHVSIEVSVFISEPARICPSINERALINASPIGRLRARSDIMSKIDVLEDEEDEEVDRQPGIAIKE